MGLLLNLSLLSMVLTLVLWLLVSFIAPELPFRSLARHHANGEEAAIANAEETPGLFSNSYKALIGEIVSYQTSPDPQRAEARRQEITAYANALAGDFQVRKGELSEETVEAAAAQAELKSTESQ